MFCQRAVLTHMDDEPFLKQRLGNQFSPNRRPQEPNVDGSFEQRLALKNEINGAGRNFDRRKAVGVLDQDATDLFAQTQADTDLDHAGFALLGEADAIARMRGLSYQNFRLAQEQLAGVG